MTVPGKGGRPRKWRSDADRVRAFRARQRGEEEPPTIDVALGQDDEVALAWERVRALTATVKEQQTAVAGLRTEVRESAKEVERTRTRFSWIDDENERLKSELENVRRERDALRVELDLVRSTDRARIAPDEHLSTAIGMNRAQRRRAQRARRAG
jgi:predicted RNase H-like nuclease (RuvC/YqgF family)